MVKNDWLVAEIMVIEVFYTHLRISKTIVLSVLFKNSLKILKKGGNQTPYIEDEKTTQWQK